MSNLELASAGARQEGFPFCLIKGKGRPRGILRVTNEYHLTRSGHLHTAPLVTRRALPPRERALLQLSHYRLPFLDWVAYWVPRCSTTLILDRALLEFEDRDHTVT